MKTKRILILAILMAAVSALAQRVPENQVAAVWQDNLSAPVVQSVKRFVSGKTDTERWIVYSAVVRSKEFHEDYLPGEPMDTMKVLSAVRVRSSTDDANALNNFWRGLDNYSRAQFVTILRRIQTGS